MSEAVVASRMLLQLQNSPQSFFYSPVRGDRSGAQIHDELMAYAFCFAHGLRYGGPAGSSCDSETSELRAMLGLPSLATRLDKVNLLSRLYRDDTGSRRWRGLVAGLSSLELPSESPSADEMYTSSFLKHLQLRRNGKVAGNSFPDVTVHIRRGDVSKQAYPERYLHIDNYLDVFCSIRDMAPTARITVHSQSDNFDSAEIQELKAINVEIKLDAPLQVAWLDMIEAKVFVMARSSFSYVPALFSQGLVIYQNFWHQKRSNWLDFERCQDPVVLRDRLGPVLA